MRPITVSPAPEATHVSDSEALELIGKTNWYHAYELRPGLITPGHSGFVAADAAGYMGIPDDLSGKTALDIGAWDGPMTFELERRGAKTMALDIQDPTRVGFDTARRIIGSQVTHYQGSVYQLPFDEMKDLDIVVFKGVYYHLKYPLLAFEQIAQAMKIGGHLYFEGEGLLNYAENFKGEPVSMDFESILNSGAPVCLITPNRFKDGSNWFIPTPACLRSVMQTCGFEVIDIKEYRGDGNSAQRLYGSAVKVRDEQELEHPFY
jgi:tRNA (mo5U34)-methyltransferase